MNKKERQKKMSKISKNEKMAIELLETELLNPEELDKISERYICFYAENAENAELDN